ncbi:MAG: Y4bD/Y4pK family protein, partial [Actinobacteria bacterium]|nr:Y4bD/Y4pK family protein [Actinomycetota bacterium]
RRKTRHTAHLDGFPERVRIVRARHPLEGRSLELIGWMRRRGRLELILVVPDGGRSLIPAAWTDLSPPAEQPQAGTLASLDDLIAARRVLDGVLRRCVLPAEDDRRRRSDEEADPAAAPRPRGEPGAGDGALGAAPGRRARGGSGTGGEADRADGRTDRRGRIEGGDGQ